MKKTVEYLFIILLTFILFSCKSEREKKVEAIRKESNTIFSNAITDVSVKGYKVNIDSLMNVYTKISVDSAELGLEYAKKIRDDAASLQNPKTETSTTIDTAKYFELKLVSKEYYGSYAKLTFQLKSMIGKHTDKFWLKASLRDKNGEYLAGENNLMWDNIRPNGMGVEEASWENINLNEIGGVILSPNNLEIEGQNYRLDGNNIRIVNNKFKIKVSF